MAENDKKPFYKKWWFWLIIIIILLFAFFGGGDEEEQPQDTDTGTEDTQNNKEGTAEDDTGNEAEDGEEPANEDEPSEGQNTRDNSSAEETTLNAGTFAVGMDIPVGRYVITGDGMGNLFVYDEAGLPVVNEILDTTTDMGVSSVTTDLEDGQEIEISGLDAVTFTPA